MVADGRDSTGDELDEVRRLVDAGEWSDALKALGPLRRGHESDPQVWELQALALRGAGELTEAQFAADRWAVLKPGTRPPLELRVELLIERGKSYPAVEVAEEIVALAPDDALAYQRVASCSRAAGLVPRARVAVTRSLEIDPLRPDTYELAGMIELSGSQPAAAIDYFRQALRLDPDNGRVAVQLQRALDAQQAKTSGAKQTTKRAKTVSKQSAKQVRSADREREKGQRKADRKLGLSRSGDGRSRRDRIIGWGLLVVIVLMVLVLRFR